MALILLVWKLLPKDKMTAVIYLMGAKRGSRTARWRASDPVSTRLSVTILEGMCSSCGPAANGTIVCADSSWSREPLDCRHLPSKIRLRCERVSYIHLCFPASLADQY